MASLARPKQMIYTGMFDSILSEVSSLLVAIIPYALGIFAFYLALKFAKWVFDDYTAIPDDIKRAREISAETDRILKTLK